MDAVLGVKRIGECTDCGKCCKANVGFGVRVDGWCMMYDAATARCKDYGNRPEVCRAFPKTQEQALFCEGEGCYKFVEIAT